MKLSLEQIEVAVDADGAWNLLLALELILHEKAAHLDANWQDRQRAQVYVALSKQCGALARRAEKENI